jgi:hypothetical protein
MPIPKRYYDELQRKRKEEYRQAERDRSRDLFRTGVSCVVWCVAGLVVFAFAFHTTDPVFAEVYRWGAYIVTYGGIFTTLARAYLRGERRGDW